MSLDPNTKSELLKLIAAERDGELLEEQSRQLRQLVVDDADAAWFYLQATHLQSALFWKLGQPELTDATVDCQENELLVDPEYILSVLDAEAEAAKREAEELAVIEYLAAEKLLAIQHEQDRDRLLKRSAVTRKVIYAASGLFTAAAIVGVMLFVGRDPGPTFVAKIVGTSELVWNSAGAAKPSETILQEGQVLDIETGLVQLEFGDGARVILEGPSLFTIQSPGAGRLELGKLVARVSQRAHGFRIDTPEAQIIDLGTEFAVEIEHSGRTDLLVFEGSVEARVRAGRGVLGPPRILTEGASLQFLASSVVRDGVRIEDAHDLRQLASRLRESGSEPDLERGLLAYYSFETSAPIDEVGQIGDGRNVGSPGYVFDAVRGGTVLEVSRTGGENYVQVAADADIPEGSESRTIAFWVRMDDEFNNAGLFHYGSTRTEGRDFSVEQTTVAGVLTSNIWGREDLDFTIPSDPNAWHHVVVTYDGTTVRAYVDGLSRGSKTIALNTSATGLSFGGPRFDPTLPFNSINGRLDDVYIYSRDLSANEVMQLYTPGTRVPPAVQPN